MTILTPSAESLGARLLRFWLALFRLSWPVVLNRAGLVLMGVVSVVMVGRYDTGALAGFALGNAVVMPLLVAGIGCLVGVIAVTAREHGGGGAGTAEVALRGLHWSVAVGVAGSLAALFAGPILGLIGQEPALVSAGARVAVFLAPGVLLHLVFVAASFWLEGTGRTRPGLVAMAGANVVNLGLSWILIGGRLGAPEMGAAGAALATTLARAVMIVGFIGWLLRLPEFAPFRGRFRLWGPGGWAAGVEMRRIGVAGGASYFLETMAFATMAQAAGLLGETPLAAYSILHNIETTVFMVALGLSVGTAVRIGQAAGAGDRPAAGFAGFAGASAAIALAAVIGIVLFAAAPSVVGFYSSDPTLIARAAPIMAILALSMTFDAGQVAFGQATRALGDGWGTTLCYVGAFWGVMVPLGLGLAFWTPLAESGLFIGTAAGCIAAAGLLGLRFRHLLTRV
ncbi:MAG: MATE family efflux transporter [Amaricoccus sp.]|uniref:MATE family efflux transporter n=1 Tax=Amaricoccus sp. TaxID=1872485 RepID=UPI0039E21542